MQNSTAITALIGIKTRIWFEAASWSSPPVTARGPTRSARKVQQVFDRSVSKECRKGVLKAPAHSRSVQVRNTKLDAHAPSLHIHLHRHGYRFARRLVLADGLLVALANHQALVSGIGAIVAALSESRPKYHGSCSKGSGAYPQAEMTEPKSVGRCWTSANATQAIYARLQRISISRHPDIAGQSSQP